MAVVPSMGSARTSLVTRSVITRMNRWPAAVRARGP